MKKNILFFTFALFLFNSLFSQTVKQKKLYLDIMLEQNIMLNKWHKNAMYNDALESLSSTDLFGRLDYKLYKDWGAWVALGFGVRPNGVPVSSSLNLFDNINLDDFYIKNLEKIDQRDGSKGISFKFMLGVFYKYTYKDWLFTPYLGVSSDGVTANKLTYTLKQKGTNTAYDIVYRWFDSDYEDYRSMTNIYFQFKTDRKISEKLSLSLGVSFRYYLIKSVFSASMYDNYDKSLITTIREPGQHINTIGISTGVSF